jgi:cell division septation protein DedD
VAPDPAPAAFAAPAGPGYAVQIAALNVRTEADAIAKRLTSKGYSAYVLAPSAGTPKVFRVRVGKFPTRKEAESVATKLQKEEQFKPWITR